MAYGRLLIFAGAVSLCVYTVATYVNFCMGHLKAYQYPALQKLCLRYSIDGGHLQWPPWSARYSHGVQPCHLNTDKNERWWFWP